MSNVRDLYTNLAAVDISFTKEDGVATGTIDCRDLNELPDGVLSGTDLPVRLLLPVEEWGANAPNLTKISSGSSGVSARVPWMVVDLLLWEQVGNSQISEYYPDLVKYCGAHVEAMLNNKDIATNVYLQSATYRTGTYQFPMNAKQQYFGVEAMITYWELINP